MGTEYAIVGELKTGAEVLPACRELRPDLVLLDLSLLDLSGLDVLGCLRAALPDLKVLILTMHNDRLHLDAALKAGAQGFVPKDSDPAELQLAIKEVLQGREFVPKRIPEHGPQQVGKNLRSGSMS